MQFDSDKYLFIEPYLFNKDVLKLEYDKFLLEKKT